MISPALRLTALGLALGLLAATAGRGPADDKKVEVQVGDPSPVFNAKNHQDKTWSSSDHVGKKWVVIYFYPGDFTPGCTAQAQKFRDNMNILNDKGIAVVGVSGDTVPTHDLFKKVEKLNFTLLADEEGGVAKKFGVPLSKGGEVRAKDTLGKIVLLKRDVTAARWTFIVGKDGKIAYKNMKVTPAADAKQILEFVLKAEAKKE